MTNMDMVAHQSSVRYLGQGNYVTQLRLYMAGPWLITVQAQADGHARLSGARDKLLAQLQSGARGLDSLVARVAELTAATTDVAIDTGAVRELSDQLEGIRQGVLETEQATRKSLG